MLGLGKAGEPQPRLDQDTMGTAAGRMHTLGWHP